MVRGGRTGVGSLIGEFPRVPVVHTKVDGRSAMQLSQPCLRPHLDVTHLKGSEKTVKMQGMEWKGVEGQGKGSGRPMQRQWKVKAKAVEGQGQSVEGQGSAVTR